MSTRHFDYVLGSCQFGVKSGPSLFNLFIVHHCAFSVFRFWLLLKPIFAHVPDGLVNSRVEMSAGQNNLVNAVSYSGDLYFLDTSSRGKLPK